MGTTVYRGKAQASDEPQGGEMVNFSKCARALAMQRTVSPNGSAGAWVISSKEV